MIRAARWAVAALCLLLPLQAVAGENAPPEITSFGGDTQGAQGEVLDFFATAVDPEGQPLSFRWSFSDGFPPVEAIGLSEVTNAFNEDGQYEVSLTVTDPGGLTDSRMLLVTIGNGPPVISAMNVPGSASEGGSVRVDAVATDPGDDELTYTWDFGDETDPQTGAEVVHTFADAGLYTVTLEVEDPGGLTDSSTRQIEVTNVAPTITQFIGSEATDEGAGERFSGLAVGAEADVLTYRWVFSDGSPPVEGVDLTEINHAFADDGEYTVTLIVTDDEMTTATREHSISVANVAPRITSAPPRTILIDRDYVYEVEADDPGEDTLTLRIDEGPQGMSVDGNEVRWRINAEVAQDGPWPVIISMDDGDGGVGTQQWTLSASVVDLDEDGVPDDCEEEFGLNPNDPNDANLDPDQDGRTNREECNAGTNPIVYNGPTAPEVVGPVALERVATRNPVLTVENATDPDGDELEYEFIVYSDDTFTEIVTRREGVAEGEGTTSWTVSGELEENGRFWWRARAADPYVSSGFSVGGSMFIDSVNDPPGVPNTVAPSGGADMVSPAFTVDAVTDPEGDAFVYRFEVYTDSNLTEVAASWTDTEPVSAPPEPLVDDRQYYWRARGEDELGSLSEWSERLEFFVNVENVLPPAPVLTSPEDGGQVRDAVAELVWEPVMDPDNEPVSYEYQVSRDEAFTRTQFDGSTVETRLVLEDLVEDVVYFARVRARDPAGAGPYTIISFLANAENTPPAKPVQLSPIGALRVDVGKPPVLDDVVFTYEPAVDIDGDAVTHTVAIVDESGDLIEEVEADGDEASANLEAGRYSWTVYGRDAQGVRGESAGPEEFVVIVGVNEPPTAPTPLAPLDDVELSLAEDIELVIVNASDEEEVALTYVFAVYTSNRLEDPVWTSDEIEENPEGQTTAILPGGTLEAGENERFFWHAWAVDDLQVGSASETATFTRALPVVTPPSEDGCGCRTVTPAPRTPWLAFVFFAGALAWLGRRRNWARAAAAAAVLTLSVAVVAPAEGQTKKEVVADSEQLPVGGSFVRGAYDAPVTIVEYSDFQCPFCARVQPALTKLLEEYPGRVRIVFKHYPLPFHKDAPLAHEAALAAGAQGKFWEYHDVLFRNQRALKRDQLELYAADLGLDMTQFRAELDQRLYKNVVDADTASVSRVGVRGTPGFFINGKFMSGAQPYDKFKTAVDEELAAIEAADIGPRGVYAERVDVNWVKPADRAKRRPSAAPARPTPKGDTVYNVPVGKSPVRGPRKAEVTIVVFSDFQCPFCQRAAPTIRNVLDEFSNVRFVFKHNPLPFHKDAHLAAVASLAAHKQGKFWEMHDLLFQNSKRLKRADLLEYAAQLGLNRKKFEKDLDDKTLKAAVDADMKLAAKLGARGVPAFYVDGVYFAGARPIGHFRTAIADALVRSKKLRKRGLKGDKLYRALMKGAAEAPVAAAPAPGKAPAADTVHKIDIPKGAPVRGPRRAKVTIVKFGDFQCPYCARSMKTLVGLEKRYAGKVRIVYRHRPLPFHKEAHLAAQASMAANEQGKFWEYADLLYANQRALKRDDLLRYAQQLQLDMRRFEKALDSGKYKAYVDKDNQFGPTVGASGTPTFFINGRKLTGAQPESAFAVMIDKELGK